MEKWFLKRSSLLLFIVCSPLVTIFDFLLRIVGLVIATQFWTIEQLTANTGSMSRSVAETDISQTFVLACVVAPIAEEFTFRLIPFGTLYAVLYIAQRAYGPGMKRLGANLLVCFVSAFVFGYLHGCLGNVLLQGVSGLLYSLIFIKLSSLGTSATGIFKAYVAVVILHGMQNATLLFITVSQ